MKKNLFKTGIVTCLLVVGCSSGESVSDSGVASSRIQDATVLTGLHEGDEYVDLGLSVMWATCNVGASSPNETGGHFAWGENYEKEQYDYFNYSLRNYYPFEARSLGRNDGSWGLPTPAEIRELIHNCTIEKTELAGKAGYCFTSKKNGGTIFFPIDSEQNGYLPDGASALYWSLLSSPYGDDAPTAYVLCFYDDAKAQVLRWPRHEGLLRRYVLRLR